MIDSTSECTRQKLDSQLCGWPMLHLWLCSGYSGLMVHGQGPVWRVVEALLMVPRLHELSERNLLVRMLADEWGGPVNVLEHPRTVEHLFNLVETCYTRPYGLATLVEVLGRIEPGSGYVANVHQVIESMIALEVSHDTESELLVAARQVRPPPPLVGPMALPSGLALPSPAGRARQRLFISYVRADSDLVDRLVLDLQGAGYDVWLDRSHLLPGMRWRSVIKHAIDHGDYFLACFSPRYWNATTYMNEELVLAVDRLRLMPRDRTWFIPVMLEKCELPDHQIGPGETLADSIQYADFTRDWAEALHRLITALGPPLP